MLSSCISNVIIADSVKSISLLFVFHLFLMAGVVLFLNFFYSLMSAF